jgi:predicted acetyltransferase
MEIKKIVSDGNYLDDYSKLLIYCFGLTEEDVRFEMNHIFKDAETVIFGAFDLDKLKSSLIINDYTMFWNGTTVRMGGIGNVASFPEARQDHLVEKLLMHSLEKMHDLKMMFSLLGPFSYSFYRKYGWEWGMNQLKYEVGIMDFEHFRPGNYTTRPLTEDDTESLMTVYDKSYSIYNGPLNRTKSHWAVQVARNKKDNNYSYGVIDQENQLAGYITYELKDHIFKVKEIAYTSLEVKEHIFFFIFIHRAQVDTVKINLPDNDPFLSMLNNQRQKVTLSPGMMVRVVDVEQTLLSLNYPSDERIQFSIKIDDFYAPWNNTTFLVDSNEAGIKVTKGEDIVADIQCSIQTFSQIAFGFKSFMEADQLALLKYSNRNVLAALDKIKTKRNTYIADFF